MGSLERRKMEGDNSCLFHAVAYSLISFFFKF